MEAPTDWNAKPLLTINTDFQACLSRRPLSDLMDRIAEGPEDVEKSVRARK
jgi:hypothetical protein